MSERAKQRAKRQQVETAFADLKREFGLGETLATTLVGSTPRSAAKIAAYTHAFLLNRVLGCHRTALRICGAGILAIPV